MSKEATSTSHVRLDAAQLGVTLLRNNSGGFYDEKERFVRYGLGSFEKKDKMKSSDYIGLTPEWAYIPRFGWLWVGVFTAVEMKPLGWKFTTSDERACHQQNFHDMVKKNGGYAGFATCPNDFRRIIGREEKR